MTINYHVVRRKNPQRPDDPALYYPSLKSYKRVSTRELANYIADRTVLNQVDVIAMFAALMKAIPDLLKQGAIVEMGELGSFQPKLSGRAAETPEEITSYFIKELYPRFVPSKALKKECQGAEFAKIPYRPLEDEA